jgi:hypothetical protein
MAGQRVNRCCMLSRPVISRNVSHIQRITTSDNDRPAKDRYRLPTTDFRLPTPVPIVLDCLSNAVHLHPPPQGYKRNAKTEAGPMLFGRRSSASRLHCNSYNPGTRVMYTSLILKNHHCHDNLTYYEQQTLRLDRPGGRDHRRSPNPHMRSGSSSGAHNGNRHVSIAINSL